MYLDSREFRSLPQSTQLKMTLFAFVGIAACFISSFGDALILMCFKKMARYSGRGEFQKLGEMESSRGHKVAE